SFYKASTCEPCPLSPEKRRPRTLHVSYSQSSARKERCHTAQRSLSELLHHLVPRSQNAQRTPDSAPGHYRQSKLTLVALRAMQRQERPGRHPSRGEGIAPSS